MTKLSDQVTEDLDDGLDCSLRVAGVVFGTICIIITSPLILVFYGIGRYRRWQRERRKRDAQDQSPRD